MDVICKSSLSFLLVLLERDPDEPAREQRLEVARPLDGVQQQLRVDLVLSPVMESLLLIDFLKVKVFLLKLEPDI